MTKNLLFASAILLITSCTSNPKSKEEVRIETLDENLLTLEFASKNPEVKKESKRILLKHTLSERNIMLRDR